MKDDKELKKSLGYSGMFATRSTPQEAYDYLTNIAAACGKDNQLAVITAGGVLINSFIDHLVDNYELIPKPEAPLVKPEDGRSEELDAAGDRLAKVLMMKRDREFPGRWKTQWGSKTGTGLYRTVIRILKGDLP